MTDKPRLTLADLVRNDVNESGHGYTEPLRGILSPEAPIASGSFTIEDLGAAVKKMEQRELRPPIKIVNPNEQCHECGRRAANHSVEAGNAHVNSIAGWWE